MVLWIFWMCYVYVLLTFCEGSMNVLWTLCGHSVCFVNVLLRICNCFVNNRWWFYVHFVWFCTYSVTVLCSFRDHSVMVLLRLCEHSVTIFLTFYASSVMILLAGILQKFCEHFVAVVNVLLTLSWVMLTFNEGYVQIL